MIDELVEKVARAIYERMQMRAFRAPESAPQPWDDLPARYKRMWIKDAEAILPAIRAGVIEECAKELDAASATYRGVRERGGLSAEAVKLVLTCEQTADFCAAKVRSLAEKEI
jgi:hypothetical protein